MGEQRQVGLAWVSQQKGAAQKERSRMTREAALSKGQCTVLLHNNQPCLDAFLAEWRVISMERGDKRGEARQERDGVM